MADLKISQLPALAGSDLLAADQLAVADTSASETKRITVTDLVGNAVTLIADATIPGAKILFSAGGVAGTAIADGGVTTAKLAADSVTAAKLADESTVDLVTTLPAAGAFTGQIALDTDDSKIYVWNGSAWVSVKGAGSVNVVNGSTTGVVNITSTTSGDTCTIAATLDDTSAAAQFLGGPTGAGGTVGYRTIIGTDLPTPTTSAKGGVIVNGNGLAMSGDTLTIDNTVTAEASENHIVQYDANGLVTGGRVIAAADVPVATSSTVGVIKPGSGLGVDAAGQVSHNNSITAGTAAKVSFDTEGHITATEALAASDIPNIDASKVTTGTFPEARIGSAAVAGSKLKDYAVAQISETTPTAEFTSQFFFNPITRDLFLWDGNVFQPVGISAGEIVLAGTYDASTNLLDSVTADGSAAGFTNGQALPAGAAGNNRHYVVVSQSGNGTAPAPTVALEPPDILLSNGSTYVLIETSETITAQVASNVGFTPAGSIASTNVQAAIVEVDNEKAPKANPTLTGTVALGEDAVITFEGATDNAFETTLTVTDPTADRTITLPNVTGTVLTTGDTGTVTSTMIVDGTIVNADINAAAEIAVSKLANGTARQLLQTDSLGSGVEFTSNVDVPGTLDVTGAATLDSTLGVAGLISANGKVKFPAGTVTAPSFHFGTDTNTGLYHPAADKVAITTGGTQRVIVDSAGNVGIGTASPASPLHISSSSERLALLQSSTPNVYVAFQDSNSSSNAANRVGTVSDGLYFSTGGGGERLRIDSSGRLLVGTSSALTGANSANGILTIKGYPGGATSAAIFNLARGLNSASVSSGNTLGRIVFADQQAGEYALIEGECDGTPGSGDYPGRLVFSTTADGASTPTERLRINSDGTTTFTADASINSLTIGRGANDVSSNTVVGREALASNTSGANNSSFAYGSLNQNTTGSSNTASGVNSLYFNTTGSNNTASGHDALLKNTTGSHNSATGVAALFSNTSGSSNVAVGKNSLNSNTTASSNTAVGDQAASSNTTGSALVALGKDALRNNTTGISNVASGHSALYSNTTASYNCALGTDALYANTTGGQNTAIGRYALRENISGEHNTSLGFESLRTNTGSYNTAVGHRALYLNTTGAENSALGRSSLYSNTSGNNNVAVGYQTLYSNTTGLNNTALGKRALHLNTTGESNTATGRQALYSNTTGDKNVAVGVGALNKNTTAERNVAVGYDSLYFNTTGTRNVAVGESALHLNTTASDNTAIGKHALRDNTTGANNASVGSYSLQNNTTGADNTAVGYSVLDQNTTGSSNCAIGQSTLKANTTGSSNSAIGQATLFSNTTGNNNLASGYRALFSSTTGSHNTAVGTYSLYASTTANFNTATGYQSLYSNTTGTGNAAFGRDALYNSTTASNNTAFGTSALSGVTTGRGNIMLGGLNHTGGYTPVFNPTSEENRLVLGHTHISHAYVKVAWTVTSDERDKMNFAPVPYGLDFVNKLKPTAYQFKVDRDTETPDGDVRYGFKAQDILALEGGNPVIIDTEDADHLKYKGEHLVPVLVNAVQELTTMVNELKAELAALKGA